MQFVYRNEIEIQICNSKFCVSDLCESYSCAKLIVIIGIIETITSSNAHRIPSSMIGVRALFFE